MSVAVVTGAAGLVGSACARHFHERGLDVLGIDNDCRRRFFGPEASTRANLETLRAELPRYAHHELDVRDRDSLERLFARHAADVAVVVHAAAQPSHDWSARDPHTDFDINAVGTLNLLEATRRHAPDAVFIFVSTNKVYGDRPNTLPRIEHPSRFELDPSHPFAEHGIDESLSIDASVHSVFGASKAAADLMVQEYGRNFGLATGCFRAGCLTGPCHAGAELHGFLSYLVGAVKAGRTYRVFGYGGRQVRDNLHADDLAAAFHAFLEAPSAGAVYNIGGGRFAHCSVLEALHATGEIHGQEPDYVLETPARIGDHAWWISDTRRFERDHPGWRRRHDLRAMIEAIYQAA